MSVAQADQTEGVVTANGAGRERVTMDRRWDPDRLTKLRSRQVPVPVAVHRYQWDQPDGYERAFNKLGSQADGWIAEN